MHKFLIVNMKKRNFQIKYLDYRKPCNKKEFRNFAFKYDENEKGFSLYYRVITPNDCCSLQ